KMDIDHIFIFTDDHGKIADELVLFGLTEGSSRVHQGQGTTNRTFSFENFFLEILWVHDEKEIRSNLVNPTGLWTRANYKTNNYSPFGLCVVNNDETNKLFEGGLKYQPEYFSTSMTFDILPNKNHPDLPWTFRLPFKGERKRETKSKVHRNGIKKLTKIQFTYLDEKAESFVEMFINEPKIVFKKASEVKLILTFDNHQNGLKREFKELCLTIEY
ncbi:MAG TPA: VOC family protein, partial [Segetibacter sp.]